MKIAIITLAFNNPEQVRRTLASVALQSSPPDHFLVVDGSSPDYSANIEKLAQTAGAEYIWREPRGVYPAMNDALKVLSGYAFVWFVNSSDWLSSPESIPTVREALRPDVPWLVGGLHRYRDKRMPFHPSPVSGDGFVTDLLTGRIGFPHPSAIMSKAGIDECGGFDESYRIAGDYALALKFAKEFGAPRLVGDVLAIHDPTGLTSRHRVRHFLEKVRARRQIGLSEGSGVATALLAASSRVLSGSSSGPGNYQARVLPQFGRRGTGDNWPDDCVDLLDSWPSPRQ